MSIYIGTLAFPIWVISLPILRKFPTVDTRLIKTPKIVTRPSTTGALRRLLLVGRIRLAGRKINQFLVRCVIAYQHLINALTT